jgi:hypothetical protein
MGPADTAAEPKSSSRFSRWSLAVLALLLGFSLFAFSPLVADPDLWGHVRFGQDLWASGSLMRPDVYSYLTGQQPWINHEWLTEAVYAGLFATFGPPGLIALNVLVGLGIVGLIYWHLLRRDVAPAAAGCVTAFYTLVLRPGVLNVRPQLFTYLLFLAILLIVDAVEHGASGWLWAAPPVIALWTNLHGGALAGVGILLIWGAVHLAAAVWSTRRLRALLERPQPAIVAALLASCLALLLNPYGIGMITFLLRTATVPRPEIADWKPAAFTDAWGQLYFAGLILMPLGLLFSRRERRTALVAPAVCTAILPLLSIRHAPLFAIAASVLAGEHIADAAARLLLTRPLKGLASTRTSRVIAVAVRTPGAQWGAAALVIAALAMAGAAIPRLDRIQVEPSVADFPARAVAMLKASGVAGNMATEFNWGEYVLWHLGPRVRVSIDGRRETIYSDAVYRENLDLMLGRGRWDTLVDRPETGLALVHRGRPVFELMKQKPGWILAYQDELCAIFAREGSPALAQLRRAPVPDLPDDGAGLSFPR